MCRSDDVVIPKRGEIYYVKEKGYEMTRCAVQWCGNGAVVVAHGNAFKTHTQTVLWMASNRDIVVK